MELDKERREQFVVELLSAQRAVGGTLKAILSLSGYRVYWIEDLKNLDQTGLLAPHISVVDLQMVTDLSAFIEKRLKWNPENLFLVLAPLGLAAKLEELRPYGLYGVVPLDEGFDTATLMMVDLMASELFLRYQNEQLFERCQEGQKNFDSDYQKLKNEYAALELKNRKLEQELLDVQRAFEKKKVDLEQEVFQLRKNQGSLIWLTQIAPKNLLPESHEQDPIPHFFDVVVRDLEFAQVKLWFLKFIPEVQSFSLVYFLSWPEARMMQNAPSFHPQTDSPAELIAKLMERSMNQELQNYLNKNFGEGNYNCYPLSYDYGIEGIIVTEISGAGIDLAEKKFNLLWNYFYWQFGYRKLWNKYEKTIKHIDQVTQLEGRDSYFRKLHEEYSRVERLRLPLAIIKVAIDSFDEIQLAYGKKMTNSLLFQVAQLIRNSGRIHDFHYRTGDNEFSLLLPHTFVQGAVIRAERLRRMVEVHNFSNYPPGHITISCGVSGIPELVQSIERLDASAVEALDFIRQKTYNKVCLYRSQSQSEGNH
ncbi:MAG: diguanylate cyclase [Bdellovibrionaceae bacterium]|nr:diguanylate cyclase [Pseudobdellovibrionaceae bacterium]MDW8191284.1 diguanylate cyclase [Pseudobdellovibrionaceae bacterium]